MDPIKLSKLGNVTIRRLPSKPDITESRTEESIVKSSSSEDIVPFPKLPPSINITLKKNISSASDQTNKNGEDEVREKENPVHKEGSPSEDNNPGFREKSQSRIEKTLLAEPKHVSDEIEINTASSNIDHLDCNEPVESEDSEEEEEALVSNDILEQLPSVKEELEEIDESKDKSEVSDEEVDSEMVGDDGKILERGASDEEADDELDDEAEKKKNLKKKRKPVSEDESKELKKQKTSQDVKVEADTKDRDKEKEKEKTSELKVGNLRRNIREVMDDTKLDEATLAAQMQEKERLRRVQEQLKANRDVQRQMRVLSRIEKGISAGIKKEERERELDVEDQKPNTVVVKLTTGSSKHMLDMLKKHNSPSASEDEEVTLEKFANLSKTLDKPQMMTASVSIAPVLKEPKIEEILPSPVLENIEMSTGKDNIVTISSGSEDELGEVDDDDDDCIVISEEESEPEEDTANSGMHTNDLYNVPDDQGRVLVNVGHPKSEEDVFLAPQISRIIKPHQIGGVRFLFDNLVESLDRYKMSEGFGCILAHSMGLGKTLQVISFCDVFLRYTEGRTVLCIMPINTLQNWVAEFNKWLPVVPETSPLKDQGKVLGRQFPLFVLNDNQKTLSARSKVISQWYKDGGVLLIGYELYRQLCFKKLAKSRTRSKKKMVDLDDDISDDKSKSVLENIHLELVRPGPDLVICDEGHRIKNSHASTSLALKQIRSKRRVVLTGYPLQNNLLEYWCMVDFVRPNYLGTKTEFSNMFERPIQNGQCIDSTPQDVKLMRYRAHVLHSLLQGFVQRRSHSVLQQSLPTKYEFVILLRLTPFQKKLYNTFMNEVVRTKAVPNPLKAFAVCCKIWNHPDILYNFLKKRAGEEDIDLDLDETTTPNISTPGSGPVTPAAPTTPPQQAAAGKRNRNRVPKKSQNKEAKVPRKNNHASTPQPINKPPSIAAVPPNTASNPKPVPPELCITTSNNQPIPPFNSFNNSSQNVPKYNQTNDTFTSQTANSNATFNSQFNQPQTPQQQQQQLHQGQQPQLQQPPQQDFSIQSVANNTEYPTANNYQQNYSDDYYQDEFQSNNYWPSGNSDANTNFYPNSSAVAAATSTATADEYYQSTRTSSQQQFSQAEYSQTNQNQPNYNQSYNFDMGQQMYSVNSSAAFPKQERQFVNDSMYGENIGYANVNPNMNQLSDADTSTVQQQQPFPPAPSFQNNPHCFSSFPAQSRTGGKPRGRPPSTARPRGSNINLRSGVIGRRRIPNEADPAANVFPTGLPGGAPVQGHSTHNSEFNTNAYSNDVNPSFIDSINNEELWNPSDDRVHSNLYNQQNYGYGTQAPHGQNQSFVPDNTPSLLGGVRLPRNLINDLSSNEIFNPQAQPGFAQTPQESLFIDNYNTYLENITPGTSFMGLLHGDEAIEEGGASGSGSSSKDVTYNIQGLTRSNQITLEVVDKKNENAIEKGTGTRNDFSFAKEKFARLPSVNVFTSQSFEGSTPTATGYKEEATRARSQASWPGHSAAENSQNNFNYNSYQNSNTEDLLDRFTTNQSVSLINVGEKKESKSDSARTQLNPQIMSRNPAPQTSAKTSSSVQSDHVERSTGFTKPAQPTTRNLFKDEDDLDVKIPTTDISLSKVGRDVEPGIPYDWTNEFFKDYEPGKINASGKMMVFFFMLEEIVQMGDRLLLFSQSLFTLDLIEDFLQLSDIPGTEEKWARNKSYFRLDGSTSALEREKLINEFNSNSNVHLFLVSTRAGSLGINLVGANRVIVFDASWNPCHDTQAVCRVYRYGQQKNCYVYRFVMDNCLEKKIYDRQINKQGMSDRIVDECNPDAHLTLKDVTSLCYDAEEVPESTEDFKNSVDKFDDIVIKKVIDNFGSCLSKEPFIHESLLVDRKDSKLSQAEKRMAQRGYELEKQANSRPYSGTGGFYNPQSMPNRMDKPMASVRPMIADNQREVRRWIPAEVWQKQGMSAQEMKLPLDVVIPTSTTDNCSSIVLKAGQKVMVLKSPKGIYMQLENGKIVAIKTSSKPGMMGNGKPIGTGSRCSPGTAIPGLSGAVGSGVKMIARPPGMSDRNMSAMSRRDATLSPSMRSRFPRPGMSNQGSQASMQTPQNMIKQPHQGFRSMSRSWGLPVTHQFSLQRPPMTRPGPQQVQSHSNRPQNQLPASTATSATKPIFGPNSAVTISVANKKKRDTPVQHVTAIGRGREGWKDVTSHLTEVSYDDYNQGSSSQYSDFGDTQSPKGIHFGTRNETYPARPAQDLNAIPESLRLKKDINLTPVMKTSPQQTAYQQAVAEREQPTRTGQVPVESRNRVQMKNTSPQVNTDLKNQKPSPLVPKTADSRAVSIFSLKKESAAVESGYVQGSSFHQQLKGGGFYGGQQQQQQQQQPSQQQQFQGYYQGNSAPYYPPGFNQQSAECSPPSQSFAGFQASDFGGSFANDAQFQNQGFGGGTNKPSGNRNYGRYDSYYKYGQEKEEDIQSTQPPSQ